MAACTQFFVPFGSGRVSGPFHRATQFLAGTTTVTTYYYRTAGGLSGNTTNPAAIPAGAVVELAL